MELGELSEPLIAGPLRLSRFSVLQVTESWAGAGNEATPRACHHF